MSSELDMVALGKRLAQCPMFRWLDGMLAIPPNLIKVDGIRIYWQHPGPMGVHNGGNRWPVSMHGPYVPHLGDPATVGCLLSLVRDAYAVPELHTAHVGGYWHVENPHDESWDPDRGSGPWDTEAAALVAALEAAEVQALDEKTRQQHR